MATTRKAPLPGKILVHLSTPSSIQPWAMATTNQRSHLPLPHQSPTRRLLMKDKRRNVTDEMVISLKVPNQLLQPSQPTYGSHAQQHSGMYQQRQLFPQQYRTFGQYSGMQAPMMYPGLYHPAPLQHQPVATSATEGGA